MLQITKQVIYGDGVDYADVIITGNRNETATVYVNGEPQEIVLLDEGDFGREVLRVTCDTPNETVLVECGGERVAIHVVGRP